MRRRAKGGGGLVLVASTLISGAVNYGYTVLMLHLLSARSFSHFALVSSLLLLAGTCAAVAVPWVLAREVAQTAAGSDRRRHAVRFALVTSLLAGMVTAGAICLLAARYANTSLQLAATGACLAVFLNAVGLGYLQGAQRFARIGSLQLTEVLVKIGAGAALVVVLRSATAAVTGVAVGAGVTLALGLWAMRRDLGRRRRTSDGDFRAAVGREALGLTAVQGLVSLLQAVDVVVIGLLMANTSSAAGYQAMLVLARTPAYLATPLSAVAFAKLVAAGTSDRQRSRVIHNGLRAFLVFGGLTAAVVATLPRALFQLAVPAMYAPYRALLVPLTLVAVANGVVSLSAACLQADRRYRTTGAILLTGILVVGSALAVAVPRLPAVAWTLCGGVTLAAIVLAVQVSRTQLVVRWPLTALIAPATAAVTLTLARPNVLAWTATLVCLSAATGAWFLLARPLRLQGRHRIAVPGAGAVAFDSRLLIPVADTPSPAPPGHTTVTHLFPAVPVADRPQAGGLPDDERIQRPLDPSSERSSRTPLPVHTPQPVSFPGLSSPPRRRHARPGKIAALMGRAIDHDNPAGVDKADGIDMSNGVDRSADLNIPVEMNAPIAASSVVDADAAEHRRAGGGAAWVRATEPTMWVEAR